MKKSILLTALLAIGALIFYQCKRNDLLSDQDFPDKKFKPCTTTLVGTPVVDEQLDEIAKSIASIDHYVPKNDFLKIIHDNLNIYDELDFKTIDQIPSLSLSVASHNVAANVNSTYAYSNQSFAHALERENETVNYQPGDLYTNDQIVDCAVEEIFNIQYTSGGKSYESWIMYSVPHKSEFDWATLSNLHVLVVPKISEGFHHPGTTTISAYEYDHGTGKVEERTFPSFADFEDQHVDLDPGQAPQFYIIYVYIRSKMETPTDFGITCPTEFYCGDGHCDESPCGEESFPPCTDCDPQHKKQLRVKNIKVLEDYKDRLTSYNPDKQYRYREEYFSGRYEIMASYLIVHGNGTLDQNWAYIDNDNPSLVFPKSHVKRVKKRNGNYIKSSSGVPTTYGNMDVLSETFNPLKDKVYIMFFEADADYTGNGGAVYVNSVPFDYVNGSVSGSHAMKYQSSDAPFGDKPWDFYWNSWPFTTENNVNGWKHIYEIDGSQFMNNGAGKGVFSNSGSAPNYGLEFELEYDL